jgi:ATP-dependent DNA helicase RecQ
MVSLDDARAVLARHFGYDDFRPGQREAVEGVLSRRDMLILMPTGGGKSLCYQVPSQVLPGVTIVVSPLISLMKDQVDNLRVAGIAATFVNSTLPRRQIEERLDEVARGATKLLYIAPERFESSAFRERLKTFAVSLFAIDEAHCVSQWGHDFRPSYAKLGDVRNAFDAPVLALTASATPEVRRDIIKMLRLRNPTVVARGFDRPNLQWSVVRTCDESEKDHAFVQLLRGSLRQGSAIGYAATRKRVEKLSDLLNSRGVRSVAYHAGLTPKDRHDLQEKFIAGKSGVVVATNAFGMGIDKPDVRLVVHYDYPASLEAYYQEAGRAGRDRKPARCVVLYGDEDHRTHEFLIDQAHPSEHIVRSVFDALTTLHAHDPGTGVVQRLAAASSVWCSERQVEAALRMLQALRVVEAQRGRFGDPRFRLVVSMKTIRAGAPAGGIALRIIDDLIARHGTSVLYSGITLPWRELRPYGEREDVAAALAAVAAHGWIEFMPAPPNIGFRVLRAGNEDDWSLIRQQRKREQMRLERMRGYATTTTCRRAYLLRYFGDVLDASGCAGCDNCELGAPGMAERVRWAWRRLPYR